MSKYDFHDMQEAYEEAASHMELCLERGVPDGELAAFAELAKRLRRNAKRLKPIGECEMSEFVKFKDIGQYRNVIKDVRKSCQNRETGEMLPLPKVTFTGTVKLHGTNAGVSRDSMVMEVYPQSRTRVLSVESDNYGFAAFVESRSAEVTALIDQFEETEAAFLTGVDCMDHKHRHITTLFGEWCGVGIQSGMALNHLDRRFVLFFVAVSWRDEDNDIHKKYFYPEGLKNEAAGIHNVLDMEKFEIEVDFAQPESAQNEIVGLVQAVEDHCPAGKYFGVDGIGEGIVWSARHRDGLVMFKTKGQKHSISKVKKIASVDPERVESIQKFAEYAVTENRMNQAVEQVFNGEEIDRRQIGSCIKWIMSDIAKEEGDVLGANGLSMKDVSGTCVNRFKNWFFAQDI